MAVFFQAEDGIRDGHVTGVQTCALPICRELETDALVRDLADRLWRLGLLVESDFGLTSDRIELALGHPDLPGHLLLAVDTDGARYVATASQRERDRKSTRLNSSHVAPSYAV